MANSDRTDVAHLTNRVQRLPLPPVQRRDCAAMWGASIVIFMLWNGSVRRRVDGLVARAVDTTLGAPDLLHQRGRDVAH